MKHTLIYLTAAFLLAFGATSCLDKYPEQAIPEGDAMHDFDEAEQILTGIYATMKSSSLFSGSLTLLPDIQADLVYAVEGNSNVYGDIWQWKILSINKEIEGVYADLYDLISSCNFFLDRIGDVLAAETDDARIDKLEQYTGEVHGIRALAYSELAKCFCKAYDPATAANELGLVLRSSYFRPEPLVRASLKDTYDFILRDLDEAEKRLDVQDDNISAIYFTAGAVQALRARVALYMQDWDGAIEYASKLIERKEHKVFRLADATTMYTADDTYFTYMWNYDLAYEVIFRIGFTDTSYGGALGTVFLNLNRDYASFYPDFVPAQWVLNAYENNDLRYDAYFTLSQTGYANGFQWPLLTKYMGNQNFFQKKILHVTMPKPFRLAEQYLIRAEAYCWKGDLSRAGKDLTELHRYRYASGGSVSLPSEQERWLDYISQERVRELVMEGFRLHDLKRWKRGFERKPQQQTQAEGSSLKIEASDPLFVWPIPQHELQAPGSQVQPNESNK